MTDKTTRKRITDFFVETAETFILQNFDKNKREDETIREKTSVYSIRVFRSCFPNVNSKRPYFEDYSVHIATVYEGDEWTSHFYLEWDKNNNNKLTPASDSKVRVAKRRKLRNCL